MPTIPGSKASGAVIRVRGITGGLRGQKFNRPDGATVRPSLVVIDDPQTDESSRSPSQCETRERILAGAILGLAGPGKKISGIMPCTVLRPGDMADNILDRQKHPEWNGTRTKMVYSFPAHEKLWEEYSRIRFDSLRAGRGGKEATDYYESRRGLMDEGARVAWEARYNHDEISAIQHAMNLKLQDERAFCAEYQNEPLPDQDSRPDDLLPDDVAHKLNRIKRGQIPVICSRVTAFIDVHASLLYYVVCAWDDGFTGYIIDYGAYPDQHEAYFTLDRARITLGSVMKGAGLEGQIHAALEALTGSLLTREWQRDDGAVLKVEKCLIDANWGPQTQTIYQFCRQSAHAAVIMPSHGKYIGASGLPMAEYTKRPGDKVGFNWRIQSGQQRGGVRRVLYDTNFWKSFVHTRLSVAMGDRGCLSLFGSEPLVHRCFADHICSEFRVITEGRGRRVEEWKAKPERPDNHWFDCLVGSAVAASIQGAELAESRPAPQRVKPRKVCFSALQRRQEPLVPIVSSV